MQTNTSSSIRIQTTDKAFADKFEPMVFSCENVSLFGGNFQVMGWKMRMDGRSYEILLESVEKEPQCVVQLF